MSPIDAIMEPRDTDARRRSARRTALIVAGVAVAVYLAFLLAAWL